MRARAFIQVLGLLMVLGSAVPARAQVDTVTREYVQLRPPTFGLLYGPTDPRPESSVGLVLMHPNANYLNHVGCTALAERGFRVLCINGQYFNTRREYMIWEKVPLDVKLAVEYLRQLPGIQTVVLLGHSGGGQLMPFYQNLAENGPAACRGQGRFVDCPDDLAGLPPADALVDGAQRALLSARRQPGQAAGVRRGRLAQPDHLQGLRAVPGPVRRHGQDHLRLRRRLVARPLRALGNQPEFLHAPPADIARDPALRQRLGPVRDDLEARRRGLRLGDRLVGQAYRRSQPRCRSGPGSPGWWRSPGTPLPTASMTPAPS
jgi:hypothetical protein